jgi:putative redox protein
MADDSLRSVRLERIGTGRFLVHNTRGGSITIGSGSSGSEDFTPVELLLAAIGGCTGIDVDLITTKRVQPTEFTVEVTGDKVRDDTGGNRMVNLAVRFTVEFPDGEPGDVARERLPGAVKMSHDRICTVSRTVELGTPVAASIG